MSDKISRRANEEKTGSERWQGTRSVIRQIERAFERRAWCMKGDRVCGRESLVKTEPRLTHNEVPDGVAKIEREMSLCERESSVDDR